MIRLRHLAVLCALFSEVSALSAAKALQAPAQNPEIRAQMGVKTTPDTVTIGDPFILVVRVKVTPGFAVEFPQMPDSTDGTPSKIALVGQPLFERPPNDSLEFRATYKLTAWDVGAQPIPLTDVHIVGPEGTGFLPLRASVFVKSVLPADTSQHVPKPPRAQFPVHKTNWWPLIILAIAALLAELFWWIYKRWRARRNAPRDPYVVAMEEFARVEALQLPDKGEPERHSLMMAEALRVYLAARVVTAHISNTPRQLIDNVLGAGLADERVRKIMEHAELLKFARARTTTGDAERMGKDARAMVDLVQKQLEPKPEETKAA